MQNQNNLKKMLEHRTLMKNKKPRFVRKDWRELSKLGMGRKKKQVWRKPKGRHNKLREKKHGVGKQPGVGYRSPREVRGTLHGLMPVLIFNEKQLMNLRNSEIAVVAGVGFKKKLQIASKAKQMGIKLSNLDAEKFLKEAESRKKSSESKPSEEIKEKK